MQQFIPYLAYNGNCREAMRFYEGAIGAKIERMMTFAESPMQEQCGEAQRDQIMHASISIGDSVMMAGDMPAGMPYEGIKGASVALTFDTKARAQQVFDALSAGGQVTMPMMPTFWAGTFGMLTDRFGASWMVSGEPVAM
jgi:PhnB protein